MSSATAGAAGLVPLTAETATAASARPVSAATDGGRSAAGLGRRRRESELPDAATRHVLSRFSSGVTPTRLEEVAAAGGIMSWFDSQLTPDDIPDYHAAQLFHWFPVLALPPYQKWLRYKRGTEQGWEMMQDLASWTMLLRLYTKRQLLEVMTDFWADVLHVPSPVDDAWVFRVEYQQLLRRNALGSFTDLLRQAIPHPCMGIYLDNVESTKTAINENLGRELLECHTVGLNYSQRDVVDSARILTGFNVDRKGRWEASYIPANHWTGHVRVLDFTAANADKDGRKVLDDYLGYLAQHEFTAYRLCRRLAVRFVSDDPSEALIRSLAKVYRDSKTQIRPVLRALVASDEFKKSSLQKVRTPVEDALATWGALRVDVRQPHHEEDAAKQFTKISKGMGQVVFDWPAPNGFPDSAAAWTGAGRLLGSMRAHWSAARGSYPQQGITYRKAIEWMPRLPARFDEVVEHVVGQVLFLPMTRTMLDAACEATGLEARDVITKNHSLVQTRFSRLMVTILDTPAHLSR